MKRLLWRIWRWILRILGMERPRLPNDGLFLLNREAVVSECITLARMKIAGVLKVPLSAVQAELEVKRGRLHPKFTVDAVQAEGVSEAEIQEVMSAVYRFVKMEIAERLEGLKQYRHGKRERIEAAKEKTA